jgi:hypothetical protein
VIRSRARGHGLGIRLDVSPGRVGAEVNAELRRVPPPVGPALHVRPAGPPPVGRSAVCAVRGPDPRLGAIPGRVAAEANAKLRRIPLPVRPALHVHLVARPIPRSPLAPRPVPQPVRVPPVPALPP